MAPPRLSGTTAVVVGTCLLALSSPARAQVMGDFSIGLGGVFEDGSAVVAVASLGLGFLFFEVEAGAISTAERCRQASEPVDNCYDWIIGAGVRHRFGPGSSPVRPFVEILGGSYHSGTGEEDTDFQFTYGATQVGGGVDARRPTSKHGIRLSVHYRRVFADPDRDQVRFLVSYVFVLR